MNFLCGLNKLLGVLNNQSFIHAFEKCETNEVLFEQNYTVSPSECNISILIYGNEPRFHVFAIFLRRV